MLGAASNHAYLRIVQMHWTLVALVSQAIGRLKSARKIADPSKLLLYEVARRDWSTCSAKRVGMRQTTERNGVTNIVSG